LKNQIGGKQSKEAARKITAAKETTQKGSKKSTKRFAFSYKRLELKSLFHIISGSSHVIANMIATKDLHSR
jgi:hypothetical protein